MKSHEKTDRVLLELIKWYALEIIEFNLGLSFSTFLTDKKTNYASVFAIEQMAENAKYLSDTFKGRHNSLPWNELRAVRNHIAHNYDDVNMDILWGVIQTNLPELVEQIESILKDDTELD